MDSKSDIRSLSLPELEEFFLKHNEKKFRARQVYEWLWHHRAVSFDDMSSLKKETRDLLSNHFVINAIEIAKQQISSDRTIKNAFRLHDGHLIEGVLIPTDTRMTACVSSQVGCSLTCKFCATGKLDRLRNLTPDEIFDQVVIIKKQSETHYNQPLTNIVFMGMGEPLLNYSNVVQAIEYITMQQGLNMAARRITVSTAGIAKMIKKMADDKVKFNLALSLHAANDAKRDKIMPINEHNNLKALEDALKYYTHHARAVVTFEYIVFRNFNDSPEDARELVQFCKKIPSKVNLIEYNSIDGGEFANTTPERLEQFKDILWKRGIQVNIRKSRGKDIDAACGQLANK